MKKVKRIISFLIMAAVLVGFGGSACASDSDMQISALIREFKKDTKCTAVSVVVADPYGTAIYGDEDGLYLIGSMTKAFTGLAIQKLIAEGRLDEEDRVSDILPGFSANYKGESCEITVGQLLTQTSGYTNREADYPQAEEGESLKDWAYRISGRELASAPGTEYAYSNVNYNLLGVMIEELSGLSYADYMEQEILLPLGLTHTYAQPPADKNAIIYGSRPGYRIARRYEIPVVEGRIPAGYFYSNAKDCERWIRIWTETVDIPDEYKELVKEVKMRLLYGEKYYSGWESFDDGLIGHSGGTPDYSSRIVFSDYEMSGVCVLTNMNVAATTDALCNGIYALNEGQSAGKLPSDVWTVFDRIFSALSLAALILILFIVFTKRRALVIASGAVCLILTVAICITMPIIFGAGLAEIAFVWAPLSFTGGLILLALVVLMSLLRMLKMKGKRAKQPEDTEAASEEDKESA